MKPLSQRHARDTDPQVGCCSHVHHRLTNRETAAFLAAQGFCVAAYAGHSEDADRRAAEADLLPTG